MTDKEKFQKTFDKLHASPEIVTEVIDMMEGSKIVPMKKKHRLPKAAVAAIVILLTLGSGTAAYATDLGGIRQIVQIWIHGEQKEAEFTAENGKYTLTYTDDEGDEAEMGGSGVVIDDETGEKRPLTSEELLTMANAPEVSYGEDESVIVYYKDQAIDITDKFKNGICHVELEIDGKPVDMKIRYKDGYELSVEEEESGYWTDVQQVSDEELEEWLKESK